MDAKIVGENKKTFETLKTWKDKKCFKTW